MIIQPGITHDSGIYIITNKVNGRCYVGRSQDLRVRAGSHRDNFANGYKINPLIAADIEIYGNNVFEFAVLEYVDCDNIGKAEQKWYDEILPYYNRERPVKPFLEWYRDIKESAQPQR